MGEPSPSPHNPRRNARLLTLTSTASLLQATAQTAHKAFASLASAAPLKVGDAVPDVEVKINDMEEKVNLSKLTGKNVFVLVPGA